MTRIRFEDLPSRNTPRNATNFNKLNNVVISSTEPNTGEEVWVQKGKNIINLFDCSISNISSIDIINNANSITGTSTGKWTQYPPTCTATFSIKSTGTTGLSA